ncbi:tetratricopeptide repeat protein [Arthrospira platensis NCB002]|uniref:tetratricopeptide repeat-containing sulfotransferase family protein n=1 Tax=Limnospira platensis TaxID=118562 RepID=UPI0001D0EE8B|nr:tetratricopeptide repeat protein [Arthrospira platensis NCB002]BAI89713.1 TPR domain protein [Arthrospira platensis NIES-39]BDT12064.1 TPR domain protein [Arthrospira platensis NIES-39]
MPFSEEIIALQLYQQANTYLAKQQFSEAIASCKTALEYHPNLAPAYKIIGTVEQLQGEFDQAEASYKKALEIEPDFAEVYANLGSLFAQQNEWQSAISFYEKAIEIKPDFGGAYRNLAKVFGQINQPNKANYCLLKAIDIEPQNIKLTEYIEVAQTLDNQGKFTQAIALYTKAMEIYPNVAEIHYNLGETFVNCQQWKSAITAYKQALEMNPDLYYVYSRLGDVFTEQQNYQEAIAAYQQCVKLKPDIDWIHFKLGEICKKQGDIKQAIAAYQKGITLQPQLTWPYLKLLELLNQLESWQEIFSNYQELLNNHPDKSAIIYQKLAEVAVRFNKWNQAIKNYQKAIEIDLECFDACLQLAQIFLRQGQPLKAIEAYIKAVNIRPYFYWSYWNLWNLLAEHNQLDVVIDIYRQKLQDFGDFHIVSMNLGEALSRQGNIQEAISHYRNASHKKLLKNRPEIASQYWDNNHPMHPNFLIIGTQKGGTTSLYNYLSKHPQVLPCIKKEVYFWTMLFYRGLDWYLSHFPHLATSAKFITGEATPHYLETLEVPQRVWEVFPSMKLIVLLRNPIIRSFSHYYHWQRLMWEKRSWQAAFTSELEIMSNLDDIDFFNAPALQGQKKYLARGIYIDFLANWMSVFPREQFLIIRSEDFYEHPQAILNQVLEFLELPPHQLHKYHPFNAGEYEVDRQDAVFQQLQEFFRPHNQKLEEFLGRQLNWH